MIEGKTADLKVLSDLWPVINNPIGNECPSLTGKPEITIKENGKTRSVYVSQAIVSDGKACLNIGGEGLFYFPVHRDFLIGPKQDSIKTKATLKLFRQGVKVLDLKKIDGQWQSDTPDAMLNWDFIERFENSLNEFSVRLRVQSDIAKGKTKMLLQTGDQTYEFYKVTSVMWAVRKPGTNWLVASDDWSFWYDFDQSLLEDRYAAEIRLLSQAGVATAQRQAALDKLEGAWSRNMRTLYHKFLQDGQEDVEFQRTALNRLKRKPSSESSAVLVQFLNESREEELKVLAGQILKLNNPKGPLYKSSLSAAEKAKVLDYWNDWWKQNAKTN